MKKLLALILSLLVFNPLAMAQETYNFYFQKAPGPKTVIQGGGNGTPNSIKVDEEGNITQTPAAATTAPSSLPNSPAPAIATEVAKKPAEEKNEHKNIQLNLGYSEFQFVPPSAQYPRPKNFQNTYQGPALSLGYHWNKYLGVELGGVAGTIKEGDSEIIYDDYGYEFQAPKNVNQAYGGLKVTPIHLSMFGWNMLEISLLGGGISFFGNETTTRNASYYGAGVNLVFNPSFAINLEGKTYAFSGNKYNSLGAFASIRF